MSRIQLSNEKVRETNLLFIKSEGDTSCPCVKREREREREREKERERERERETSRSRGCLLQINHIIICYKQDTQEARSTRTRRRLLWFILILE